MNIRAMCHLVPALLWAGFLFSASAQVSIPDPGLNAAIRGALQKPTGPLTQADMLSLTNLIAHQCNISNLQGLETALNLDSLDLQSNHLAQLTLPSTLTKLATVDISFNPLRNCTFPNGLTNLNRVLLKSCLLTNLTLPANLVSLVELNLARNLFIHF